MRRFIRRFALWALLGTMGSTLEAAPILVSADATVAGGLFANEPLGTLSIQGGLLSGVDGSAVVGPYRFYLMFTLPVFTPATVITSATLQGFYNQDWDTFDDRGHSLYQAPSNWSESTITWNNQPGAIGGVLGTFNATQAVPGTVQSWNLTSALNMAYLQHTLLFSILFRANDESPGQSPVLNNNLEYFASREFQQGARAFRLDVETATVPEPGTWLLMAAALGGALRHRRRPRA